MFYLICPHSVTAIQNISSAAAFLIFTDLSMMITLCLLTAVFGETVDQSELRVGGVKNANIHLRLSLCANKAATSMEVPKTAVRCLEIAVDKTIVIQ